MKLCDVDNETVHDSVYDSIWDSVQNSVYNSVSNSFSNSVRHSVDDFVYHSVIYGLWRSMNSVKDLIYISITVVKNETA